MQVVSHRVVVPILLLLAVLVAASELPGQQKSPVPDGTDLEGGQKAAREIYGPRFTQAKTAAQKLALAKEMLDAAAKVQDGSADQYALLKIAKDVAAGAGDVPTTLGAVEGLAERFDVPAAKLKAEALLTIARQASRSTQQKAVVEAAVEILDDLATADEYKTALDLCEAARTCAQKAKLYLPVKALNARAEDLKKREAAFQEYRRSLVTLETSPTDAAANLAAGRHLCFVKQDWEHGVAMLAKGSDTELQAVAQKDLQEAKSADEQVAVGDAWWALAETRDGREKESLRLRAGSWYRQAEPNLTEELARVKIAKRLAELPKAGADLPKAGADLPKASADLPKPSPKPGSKRAPGFKLAPGPALAVAPFDEKQAKVFQIQWSKHLKLPVELTNSIGLRLVLIPPGEFDMGSTAEDVAQLLEEGKRQNAPGWYLERIPAEAPQHRVKITKPFYLGVCEVTQAEYGRMMDQDPSKFKGDPNRPVEQVTWNEAVEFCQRLSASPQEKASGAVYRLPTEAEWEFACRAGTTTRYSFGDAPTVLGQYAWWGSNSQGRTQTVGRLRPNAWGLFDMHGNVWEWCQDWWGDRYYVTSPMDDPAGAEGGAFRVFRGGGWNYGASFCRVSYRIGDVPGIRDNNRGFRLARTVSFPPQ